MGAIVQTLSVGALGTNCYVVGCERTRKAMVVDPGDEAERVASAAGDLGLAIARIVLTHYHFDHILGAEDLRAHTGAPLAIHESGASLLASPPAIFRAFAPGVASGPTADELLHDGDQLAVGDLKVTVLATPGHSPDGISLLVEDEGVVFCGDAIFREGIGRTDFPGSSHAVLMSSIKEKLFSLPEETILYPGHGPATTVGHERAMNPWVRGE